jgi:nucleoporin GLE1
MIDVITSPYRLATDSPSRQLQWELQQLAISAQEDFNAQLDLENEQREALHREALNEATARHDMVRREAEQARAQLEQQILAERRRREEDAQKETDRLRREEEQMIAANRKRDEERARTAELEERKLAEAKRKEKEAAEKRQLEIERKNAETTQRLKEEQQAVIRRKEEAQATKVKAAQNTPAPISTTSAQQARQALQPTRSAHPSPQSEEEHQRYLTIHQRLKELRKGMASQAKQNADLKQAMGDMRREIRKSVGQVREGKGANQNQVCHIKYLSMHHANLSL